MNPFEFVIAIVIITTIGSIIKARQAAKYGLIDRREQRRGAFGLPPLSVALGIHKLRGEEDYIDDRETLRLQEEVKMLKERIHTLERIAVDKENSLAREIDSLRDPRN